MLTRVEGTNSNWIAYVALALSLTVAIGNLIGFFLRTPRVHWVLESLTILDPPQGREGILTAAFVFRNGGKGTAHLATVQKTYPNDGWLIVAGLENRTFEPESTFVIWATGKMRFREDLAIRRSSGDGIWFETDDIIKITWTHYPSRWKPMVTRRVRLLDEQIYVLPRLVSQIDELSSSN